MAASPLPRKLEPYDDGVDSEVPAAVLCTRCGRGDCPGCSAEASTASGVIAIVPWERVQSPWHVRLLDTAQATTRGADGFFRALPDGSTLPALSFALLAESLAVGSTVLVVAPLVVTMIPSLLYRFVLHDATRHAVLYASLIAAVGFSLLLIAAHAVYGLALGRGKSRTLALRFGLYACGWDLGTSPAGLIGFGVRSGPRSAIGIFADAVTAPARSAQAALAGLFSRRGAEADRARVRAAVLTIALVVPAVLLLLVAMAAAAYLAR